ncbi:MAG: ribose-phosphate diphosphokinase [Planctomycetota bacterium]
MASADAISKWSDALRRDAGVSPPLLLGIDEYQPLLLRIAQLLAGEIAEIESRAFPDGEIYRRILSPVMNRDVILVGGTVSDSATLALFDLACAVVKNGARRLTLIVPYFGYSTMERATRPGEIVTAKTRARLLSAIPPASFGNRILLCDLHSEGIPHYFEGATTAVHLSTRKLLGPVIRSLGGAGFVLASTDAGRAKWVESLANDLSCEVALIVKRRISGEETQVVAVSESVAGKSVVIYDDMVRTGSSLRNAAKVYRAAGAASIAAVCTHGVFPGDSFQSLMKSGLFVRIVSTDSHPRAVALAASGLEVIPLAELFAANILK